MKKKLVIVLGSHRSGTSMLTAAVESVGANVGVKSLYVSDENPKGFFENDEIVRFNDRLLQFLGGRWDNPLFDGSHAVRSRSASELSSWVNEAESVFQSCYSVQDFIVIKDPRLCQLLPFWNKVFTRQGFKESNIYYAHIARHPVEVAKSQYKRRKSSPVFYAIGDNLLETVSLWSSLTIQSLRDINSEHNILFLYETLVKEPKSQVIRLAEFLGVEHSRKEVEEFCSNFVDKGLKRNKVDSKKIILLEKEFPEALELYGQLELLASKKVFYRSDIRNLLKIWRRPNFQRHLINPVIFFISRLATERYEFSLGEKKAEETLNQAISEMNLKLVELKESRKQNQELQLKHEQAISEMNLKLIELKESRKQNQELQLKHEQAIVQNQELQLKHEQAIVEMDCTVEQLHEFQALHQHAISERDNRQKSYEELHKAYNQAVAERDVLSNQLAGVYNSNSWRLTRIFRAIRRYLITKPIEFLIRFSSQMARFIWVMLPIGPEIKSRLKTQLFTCLPSFFCHAQAYKNWKTLEPHRSGKETGRSLQVMNLQQDFSVDGADPYVPLANKGMLTNLPVRLIAFYLPQFHAIPENDEWWGKGFTEWSNVKPAEPQYEGHYQPHVPGELGYYDLTNPSIQKRQVELAKQYGVGGFCFYFYWFAGKRLLETPILNYLNDPSLDLPFCICWANENWSRRWDGLDHDILMAQQHSAEDDIAFIEHVSCYLRDPRNIRVDGRPLLLVYRPSLLPSPKETVKRWRDWCRENGIGEIYLTYTQSFEAEDPTKYGFDAAVEFPPNNSRPPVITDQIDQPNPEFTGIVYDWRIFVERSENYQQPDYTLFRSVTPSWDNTARRKTDGAIFANSSPAGYQTWLTRSIEDTLAHRENKDERLVFVNAWNEWAEGAYLEPDEKYGYAYLQATRDALVSVADEKEKRRIVLVTHDAYPHGAQYLILNMAKILQESMGFIVDMIVLGEGPLIEEYAKYANVHELAGCDVQGKETAELVRKLHKQGTSSAIANTTVTGLIVPVLKLCGFTVVSLIHELPQLIKDYQLEDHVKAIANDADKIVFAATAVRKGFETFVKLDKEKVVIRPQGIYKKNSLQTTEQIESARSELRKRFSLPDEAVIVLGVGFADYRKGIDIFVESGIEVLKKNHNVYFLWLGKFEPKIEKKINQKIKESGLDNHFIFPGLDYESDIYYAGADIYALTSREDPFPSVVMEALDALTPVVTFTNSGGSAELLSKGGGILVNKMTSKAFASALIKLINNPAKLNQLGQEGKKIVDEEFSFRKYLFDLAKLAQTDLKCISVVVPNYNYDQYIEERLQTIIDQSYPIYEIIILDDSSTDNSVNVINKFIKNQVIDCKFIVNADNSGNVFKQWAKGVELSAGDYVWIAEADDLSDPEFLNEVMKGFDEPSIVMSYCESKQMDSEGNILCNNYLDYVSDISQEKWLYDYKEKGITEISSCLAIKNTIPNASAVVFKHDVIKLVLEEHINEITDFRVAGDWVTYIFVLKKGSIAYAAHSLNRHRRHESGVTISSFDISQLKEIISVQKLVQEIFVIDDEIINKSKAYAQSLYEQFELSSESVAKVSDHPDLLSFYN